MIPIRRKARMRKTCSKCKNPNPIVDFYKRKSSKDGYDYWCKVCNREYTPRKKASNIFHKHNKISRQSYNAAYYQENSENIKKATNKYRKENTEWKSAYDKEYGKIWRQQNKGKVCAQTMKRIAIKKQATPKWVELDKIEKIYIECAVITSETGIAHQVDHIVPLQGKDVCGLHHHLNLRIITATENRIKWNNFTEELLSDNI
jgi:hypothetical protein